MTPQEAIKQLKGMLIVNHKEREAVDMAVKALEQYWRPSAFGDDLPPLDEDGYSKKLLVSFDNSSLPDIGEYRQDKNGNGAFYVGDLAETFSRYGLIVNGWMPLPKCYREEDAT